MSETFRGSAIGVFWILRTGALRGRCFPESLWTVRQTAGRGVSMVREETYACQLLVTERRKVHLRWAEAHLMDIKVNIWYIEFLLLR